MLSHKVPPGPLVKMEGACRPCRGVQPPRDRLAPTRTARGVRIAHTEPPRFFALEARFSPRFGLCQHHRCRIRHVLSGPIDVCFPSGFFSVRPNRPIPLNSNIAIVIRTDSPLQHSFSRQNIPLDPSEGYHQTRSERPLGLMGAIAGAV